MVNKQPNIDHLPDGVMITSSGELSPLFLVNDIIVVQRFTICDNKQVYLDTRILRVHKIDYTTGVVTAWDTKDLQWGYTTYKKPLLHIIKLVSKELDNAEINPLNKDDVIDFNRQLEKGKSVYAINIKKSKKDINVVGKKLPKFKKMKGEKNVI